MKKMCKVYVTVVMEISKYLRDRTSSAQDRGSSALVSREAPCHLEGPGHFGISHLVSLGLLGNPSSSVTKQHKPGNSFPQTINLSL